VTARYCSDVKNGYRFNRKAFIARPSVAIPGQLPLTNASDVENWVGESQVLVTLNCSNSSGNEIQCQAALAAEEERWLTRPRTD
jgi:hypothetical protein